MKKNFRALINIRGLGSRDIPEGAIVTLSAKLPDDLRGAFEETDDEATFDLEGLVAVEGVGGIGADDKDALVQALTALGAIVILPHDDGSFDLRDLPASALLSGVLSKSEAGEITQGDLSLIITDEQALADLAWRLDNGLASDKVSALLPLPDPIDVGSGEGGEQEGASEAPAAKKPAKKTAAQE
jgi:hypothetical protein